jgi:hypothetical protein
MSAACLLERYLDDEGGGALPARPLKWPLSEEETTFNYQEVRDHIRDTYYVANEEDLKPSYAANKRRYFTMKKFAQDRRSRGDDDDEDS